MLTTNLPAPGSVAAALRVLAALLRRRHATFLVCLTVTLAGFAASAADAGLKPPLKVLFLTGGGYHDYEKLAPFLTNHLARLANAAFEIKFGIEALHDSKFAEGYDCVFYDVCFDEASDDLLDHAIQTARAGKPSVMIHCSVHAFRKSPKVHEWEACCGMRSKVHDRFEGFSVAKLDPDSPITRQFPATWTTEGDELYQTISIEPESHQLLKARSPQDGREHIVCWTREFGRGRVFATTLGHDMKTSATPEYLRLVANGLLWACGKLEPDGSPSPGYAAAAPAASSADNTLTEDEKKAGWILLFDGKTLDGWMTSGGLPSKTPVEEGSINPHGCGDYMMVHTRQWSSFALSLDFKISKGCNSGVFVRTAPLTPRPGKDVGFNGLEVQILDTDTAGYYDTGAIYDLSKPTRNAMKPAGEWNHFDITCDKNIIEVVLNGEKVNHLDLDRFTEPNKRPDGSAHKFDLAYRDHPRTGYIGLQDHGAACWFKNIKLRPLDGH